MNTGNIYITGLIGTSYHDDGSVEEKGTELIDVVEQIANLDESVEHINCYIDSQGGYVSAGKEISEFFQSQNNITTIATDECMSIATIIHTSVPLQNRKIVAGTEYMIHNPWVGNQSGDASAMQEAADHLSELEDQLEKHYAKATGQEKGVLSSFMKKDTYLTMDQCKAFGFASEILPKQQKRALAILNKNNNMKKPSFKERMANALKKMGSNAPDAKALFEDAVKAEENKDRAVKALMISTDNGTLETPFDDLAVGDPVMINGEIAGPGSYQITEGTVALMDGETIGEGAVLVVAEDGTLDSIEASGGDEPDIDEMTQDELKAALIAERASNNSLKAEKEEAEVVAEEAVSKIESLASIQSNYQAKGAKNQFRHQREEKNRKPAVTKEAMKARRNSYKGNK